MRSRRRDASVAHIAASTITLPIRQSMAGTGNQREQARLPEPSINQPILWSGRNIS